MAKNIILCTDGTWNRIKKSRKNLLAENTNVSKIYHFFKAFKAERGDAISEQIVYYDAGVGTGQKVEDDVMCEWLDRIIGGITGKGLETNIIQAYEFIATHYAPEDRICGFGFSRGAYTIRAVAGLVCQYGIPLDKKNCRKIYEECYRVKKLDTEYACHKYPDSDVVCKTFFFLGVWDTVGALGIPVGFFFRRLARKKYEFMDVSLSDGVEHAFHAVAMDEKRHSFKPTLWDTQRADVEQKWFRGDHCDIGGGHKKTELSDITLKWVVEHLGSHCQDFTLKEDETLGTFLSNLEYFFYPNVSGKTHQIKFYYLYSWLNPYHREVIEEEEHPSVHKREEQALGYSEKAAESFAGKLIVSLLAAGLTTFVVFTFANWISKLPTVVVAWSSIERYFEISSSSSAMIMYLAMLTIVSGILLFATRGLVKNWERMGKHLQVIRVLIFSLIFVFSIAFVVVKFSSGAEQLDVFTWAIQSFADGFPVFVLLSVVLFILMTIFLHNWYCIKQVLIKIEISTLILFLLASVAAMVIYFSGWQVPVALNEMFVV